MTATAERRRSLVFPREHGAWGMLLIPLATGAATGLWAGGDPGSLPPLIIAALAIFWLRTPVESRLGSTPVRARTPAELRLVRNMALTLSGISVAALAWLFAGGRHRDLLWVGAVAAAAFVVQAAVRRIWPRARMEGQMIGAAGLTSLAPAAYAVVTGGVSGTAWVLWGANLLFAINQIHYVQLRIRSARAARPAEKIAAGRGFIQGQVTLLAILIASCSAGVTSWYTAAAFIPALSRGFAWFVTTSGPLVVRALGFRELAHACAFGVLLVFGMQLS